MRLGSVAVCGGIVEADEEIRAVFVGQAFENIHDLESQMIILGPGRDAGIPFQFERFAGFPGTIKDTKIDMRFPRIFVRAIRPPGTHIRSRTDRRHLIEHGQEALRIFETKRLPEMLDDFTHVESQQDAFFKAILAEQRRFDGNVIPTEILFDQRNNLRQ